MNKLLITIICTLSISLAASPHLSPTDFKILSLRALQFLKAGKNVPVLEKNESGFVRVRIPLDEEYKGITKVRLNYWTAVLPEYPFKEDAHSRPAYFESFIIEGGYTHEILILV